MLIIFIVFLFSGELARSIFYAARSVRRRPSRPTGTIDDSEIDYLNNLNLSSHVIMTKEMFF